MDAAGSNALAHACGLGAVAALDVMLRRLQACVAAGHAGVAPFTPYSPPGAAVPERACLADLGVSVAQAQGYAIPVQVALRSFVTDPAAYVATVARVAEARAAQEAERARAMAHAQLRQREFERIYAAAPQPPAGMLTFESLSAPGAAAGSAQQQFWAQLVATMGGAQASSARATAASVAAPLPAPPALPAQNAQRGKAAPKAKASAAPAPAPKAKASAAPAPKADLSHLPPNVSAAAGAGRLVGRQLTAWSGGEGGAETLEAGAGAGAGRFDQFEANERKFGLRATFDETQYTSKLDASAFTPAQLAAAERIEAEILAAEAGGNAHVREERGQAAEGEGLGDGDEEAKFSAVTRKGSRGGGGGSARGRGAARAARGT
jgi:hypothetical protein